MDRLPGASGPVGQQAARVGGRGSGRAGQAAAHPTAHVRFPLGSNLRPHPRLSTLKTRRLLGSAQTFNGGPSHMWADPGAGGGGRSRGRAPPLSRVPPPRRFHELRD